MLKTQSQTTIRSLLVCNSTTITSPSLYESQVIKHVMWTWHVMFFRNANVVHRCEQMWNVFTYMLLNQCGHMSPRPPLSGLSNEISMRAQIFKNLTWFNHCCNQYDYTRPYFTIIYTHIHHRGIISAQRLTLSPQLLTIKPTGISPSVSVWFPMELPCSWEHLPAPETGALSWPHFSIYRALCLPQCSHQADTHRQIWCGKRKSWRQGSTKWHSGDARRRVSEETNCRVWSLRLWRMWGGRREGLHSTNSHCSIPGRKWELVLTGWEEELMCFFVYGLLKITETARSENAVNVVTLITVKMQCRKRCEIWGRSRMKSAW